MPRKNYNPKNFELDVDHPWTMAIHTNNMIVLNPQLDLDHPGDLDTQTAVSISHIRKLLADIDCSVADIVNLRVSYVNTGDVDQDAYRKSIVDQMPELNGATIEMVPFARLVLPELLVEICTYAMATQDGRSLPRSATNSEGADASAGCLVEAVRCGDMIFVGEQVAPNPSDDIAAQCARIADALSAHLAKLGADLTDVVRLNVFYDAAASLTDWETCQALLVERFGPDAAPCLTAIPLPRLFPDGARIMLSAWAMRGEDGTRLEKTHAGLGEIEHTPGPALWRHALACGDMIFTGGQSTVQANGTVNAAGDHLEQTRLAMVHIDRLISQLGDKLQNVHKTNSYYTLKTVDEFNSNLQVRSDCFVKPGPGSVGLPLDGLTRDGQCIEIEAILVRA